jgi:RNA polymerase sigma-70 factor (ECF subfamily)
MNPRRGHRLLATDELVRAFVAGDEDALDELVRRHRQVPLAAARRHLRSSADVEDVAQETWFRFTVHAADIREPARLAGWLWVTAANEARRRQRHAARQRLVDSFDDLLLHQSEEEAFTTSECRAAVRRAVWARLNDRERELLALLMDARGLDYQQISHASVRPVGGIGPTRARIIRKLQSHPDVARLCAAAA